MEKKSIENEIKTSYLEYAMSVIVSRAIPDIKDGLKPVQRRILYSMSELGMTHDKPYKKSARIVGETMGKYHPHGDTAIYESLARMAQDFSLRYPLIDGQGNFGSIDGDDPAAMRYTEARLNSISEEMTLDIEKETVPFMLNFDGSLQEPEYFPTRVPNLLINGSTGIAVGMATNILPHNLKEVAGAINFAVDHPQCTVEDLMKHVKGPDFPGGGIAFYNEELANAYRTGRGRVICQGEVDLDTEKRIIIKSLPYGVNKSLFIQHVAEQVKNEVIRGITDIRDESDRTGMRVVIKIRDEDMRSMILNQLYEHSELETSISINNLVLVNNQPRTLNLKGMVDKFIEHRLDVIIKSSTFDLAKSRERELILRGLIIALENIERTIEIIKGSKDVKEARDNLMKEFSLVEAQVNSILDLRLQRLTSLEVSKVRTDLNDVIKMIAQLENILASDHERRKIVKSELAQLTKKFGDARRTKILIREVSGRTMEELLPREESVIILSEGGLLKRVALEEYKVQRRGGKGIITATRREDSVRSILVCSTHDVIYMFTNTGRVMKLKAFEIEKKNRKSVGVSAAVYAPLSEGEVVRQIMKVPGPDMKFLTLITRLGYIKKTPVDSLATMRSNGLKIISLVEDDEVVAVESMDSERLIVSVSSSGKASTFDSKEVRLTGRSSRGVRVMRLKPGDYIINGFSIAEDQFVLTVSEYGIGKRTPVNQFSVHHKGTAGIYVYKESERTGKIVKTLPVRESDEVIIATSNEKTIRLKVGDIKAQARVTSGVRLIDADKENKVIEVTRIDSSVEYQDEDQVDEE